MGGIKQRILRMANELRQEESRLQVVKEKLILLEKEAEKIGYEDRAYKPWTTEENETIQSRINLLAERLSVEFHRSKGAILSRMEQLLVNRGKEL